MDERFDDMKIADKAKLLLPAGYDEGLLLFCCEVTEEYIKSYCHLEEIPEGARNLASQMAAGCYREASDGGKPVKSVTRGDFSVTYGDVVQDALLGYNGRLNAFRKMKW